MNKLELLPSRKFIVLLFLVSMLGGCASASPAASARGNSTTATAPPTNIAAFLAMAKTVGQYSRSAAFDDFEKGTTSIVDFRTAQSVMNWLSQDENFMMLDLDEHYDCLTCSPGSKRHVKTIRTNNKNCALDVDSIASLFESSTSLLMNFPSFGGWRANLPKPLNSKLGFVGECVGGHASGKALLYYIFHKQVTFRGNDVRNYEGGVLAVTSFKDGKPFGDVTAKIYMNCLPDHGNCYVFFPKNTLLKIGRVNENGAVANLARDHATNVVKQKNNQEIDAFASNPLLVAGANEVGNALLAIAEAKSSPPTVTNCDSVAWVRERSISKSAHWHEGGIAMKCTAGRKLNHIFNVYVDTGGRWSSPGNVVGSDANVDAIARRVCE